MQDPLSDLYQQPLEGSYDCVDRIVLNAYFRMGHSGDGFRTWWQKLEGWEDHLNNAHLMESGFRSIGDGRWFRALTAFDAYARRESLTIEVGQGLEGKDVVGASNRVSA